MQSSRLSAAKEETEEEMIPEMLNPEFRPQRQELRREMDWKDRKDFHVIGGEGELTEAICADPRLGAIEGLCG